MGVGSLVDLRCGRRAEHPTGSAVVRKDVAL